MATQTIGHSRTFKAAADYRLMQYHIMYLSAEEIVTLATAATQLLMGTLENKPNINENATVSMRHGGATAKVLLGGQVNIGDCITSDGSGHGIATTTPGDEVIGRAITAGVSGDVIEYSPMFIKFSTIN